MQTKNIVSLVVGATISASTVLLWNLFDTTKIASLETQIRVRVLGAVQNQKEFFVLAGTPKIAIIRRAHPLLSIDWNQIDESEKIYYDGEIYAPFKDGMYPKFKLNELTAQEIEQLDVNANVKSAIRELLETNKELTWDVIDGISGVGETTLAILKNQIEI